MQGIYNTPLNIPKYYQQTNKIFDSNMSDLSNQGILSLLMGHRQMI